MDKTLTNNLYNVNVIAFIRGVKTAIPIVIGFIPISFAFGMLAIDFGLSLFETVLMSFGVFGGASQLMAVNMLILGSGMFEIVLATFVLNFRHFMMGMAIADKIKHVPLVWKLLFSFGLTDETFTMIAFHSKEKRVNQYFLIGLMLAAFSSWVIGTFIGALFTNLLPSFISNAMSMGLYAMFIGLLMPAIQSTKKGGIIVLIAMIVNSILLQIFSSGWSIILSTIIASTFGLIPEKYKEKVTA
ncbi:AzlC family ABC transporter permease [Schinkia azotoformans]|uniref:AzlC family ABC transporter permease n=1 Tax=Schinkia azotoformans TaxID=1454 RepID=UPI002E20DBE8|nr:AzlC family ABC transporter permease [Schinkia azotoformans]